MPAQRGRLTLPATSSYYYRRALRPREMLPAVGVALGAGLVVFYLAKLMLQRTPLRPEPLPSAQAKRGGARRPPGAVPR